MAIVGSEQSKDAKPSSEVTSVVGIRRPLLLGMEWLTDKPGGVNRYFAGLFSALRASSTCYPTAVVVGPALDSPSGVVAAASSRDPLPVRLGHMLARRASRLGGPISMSLTCTSRYTAPFH